MPAHAGAIPGAWGNMVPRWPVDLLHVEPEWRSPDLENAVRGRSRDPGDSQWGIGGKESWDGQYLYYAKSFSGAGIWRVALDGREETEVIQGPLAWPGDWTLVRDGIYYATVRRQGPRNEYTIRFSDFGSSRTIEVFHQVDSSRHLWLDASQDERWILYTEFPAWESDLMLVENLR